MREERVDVRGRMRADSHEHVADVLERVHAVRLAGGDDGVQRGDVVAGILVTDKQEVLSAESGDAERACTAVVVRRHVDVVEEARELGPVVERVRQGAVDVIRGDEALVADNLPRPSQLLDSCLAAGIPRVVLDLENVPLVDSKGLEWLLDSQDRLLDRCNGLRVVANQSLCREIMELTGVAEQCQVYSDLTSAVASFIE